MVHGLKPWDCICHHIFLPSMWLNLILHCCNSSAHLSRTWLNIPVVRKGARVYGHNGVYIWHCQIKWEHFNWLVDCVTFFLCCVPHLLCFAKTAWKNKLWVLRCQVHHLFPDVECQNNCTWKHLYTIYTVY